MIYETAAKYFKLDTDKFEVVAREAEVLQHKMWYDNYSGPSRFDFYKTKEYLYTTIVCYIDWTKDMVTRTRSFYDKLGSEPKTLIDHYNGCGLSTLLLAELFPKTKVYYFNDCRNQVDIMLHFQKEYRSAIKIYEHHDDMKYDSVCSYATIEHYEEPVAFLNNVLVPMTTKGGHIVYTADFDKIGAGHFREYIVDGEKVDGKKAARLFNKQLNIVWKGWNARPKAALIS